MAARHGGEAVVMGDEVARHQREEIGGFRPGVAPFGEAVALFDKVAVGEKDGEVAFDPHRKRRHHVGPVRVIGDLAEPLRLALGAIHAVRHVEPFERGVGAGVDFRLAFPCEGVAAGVGEGQALCVHRRIDGGAVYGRRDQFQLFAVEPDRRLAFMRRVATEPDLRRHPRRRGREAKDQPRLLHQPGGRSVVGKADGLILARGVFGAHGASFSGVGRNYGAVSARRKAGQGVAW